MSRITASKRDTITRKKLKKQRRYLVSDLKTLHKRYNDTTANFKVSYPQFCKLRPFWVLVPKVNARETCNCQRCANLSFMAEKLAQYRVLPTSDLRELAMNSYCPFQDNGQIQEACFLGTFENTCSKNLTLNQDVHWNKNVSWYHWDTKTIDTSERRDDTGKITLARVTEKVVKSGTLQELAEELTDEFEMRGLRHLLNCKHQYAVMADLKAKLNENEIIVHLDFAENYSCKYIKEVQSIHFGASRDQATIQDGEIYVRGRVIPFATISNSMRHDPLAIWTYLNPVMKWITSTKTAVRGVHFWSDEPTTQYRCKKTFTCLRCSGNNFPCLRQSRGTFPALGTVKAPQMGLALHSNGPRTNW